MALPSAAMLNDMFTHGVGVQMLTGTVPHYISLSDFWKLPERGERNPWPDRFFIPHEPYDDGGGAALAAYQYGQCPFV